VEGKGRERGREGEGRGGEGRGGLPPIGESGSGSGGGEGRGEGQGGELGLRRPGTSFFHFHHCVRLCESVKIHKNLSTFLDKYAS